MALRRSASMLLASMIVLHWATFFAWSDSSTSVLTVVNSQLNYERREKTEKTLNVVKDSLLLFQDVMENIDSEKLSTVLQGISSFASLAPGVGALVSSVINMVLAFIPQDDPVLNEVKKGFVEVNQKLDSLSIKISNLATHVEWTNYASVYSRDEATILNVWKKFDEFLDKTGSQHVKENNQNAEIFINYYKSCGAESSVSNLYRYLTVDSMSLSENLNNLLKKKFKCDLYMIGRYNLYLSSLFWKGMVLNQFYWKLTGVKTKGKEAEHVQMFKKVSEAQLSAVKFCLNNYEQYLKNDVEEITKDLSPDKKAIALKVKEVLDNKYRWYSWVVVVFDQSKSKNHQLYARFVFKIGSLVVAVDYTVKSSMIHVKEVKNTIRSCFENKKCEIETTAQKCSHQWHPKDHDDEITISFEKYAVVTQVAYKNAFEEVPAPFHRVKCSWDGYDSWISVHYSRTEPVCSSNRCKNNGKCKRLLRSNEWLCECQDGYYGDTCEKMMNMTVTPVPVPTSPVESKQQIIMKTVKKSYILIICIFISLFVLVLKEFLNHFNFSSCCQLKDSCLNSTRTQKIKLNNVRKIITEKI
ncbi:uncharacterized protein LOC124864705 [Girardinichthys multiradiatus]|uniref:uncharacterized protein LOC124863334 n=1 Tax=Girardinichthys multiradiatus TaxID=208333 RepID=UPI001FACC565|nr:uncharacterized protein LOC124863334 [Girardinichthys multiradiatus]XP_047213628.1 uncharacterized protein LOC124863334 [Girardinichthys multiradiatus]XP_047215537.1 uncharacterized protein LOC124864705 [Girardinichthys multiradiatus]XP_047215538.1 uncharacterized protein LOC124864705 [Girardinichthys multiradiatus]